MGKKNRSLFCTFVICFSDDNESRGRFKLAVKAQNLIHRKKANAVRHTAQILTDNAHLKMSTLICKHSEVGNQNEKELYLNPEHQKITTSLKIKQEEKNKTKLVHSGLSLFSIKFKL